MKMKISDDDFAALRSAIAPLDTPARRLLYRAGKFPNAERCKNVNMRYRWDLLYATGLKIGDGVGIQGDINLYAYLNDSHIDTALRCLVPTLESPHCVLGAAQELANELSPRSTTFATL